MTNVQLTSFSSLSENVMFLVFSSGRVTATLHGPVFLLLHPNVYLHVSDIPTALTPRI